MADDAICLAPATRLASMLRQREISSRELLDLYLQRIARLNPALNAVVTLDADRAREEAARADQATVSRASDGGLGPLHGLPVTIKDAIEVDGMRSTGGSTVLTDHVPRRDAPAVARRRRAGAVVFGKTNVPEWSGDIQTFNELFGTTRNPWDPSVTPGGSSGGPAVAVAAGLSSFELGTDIGGSVRIPSSFTGICGHKPSFGLVSQRGYLDSVGGGTTDADVNVFGPMARSVEDLELLMDVLAAPDPADSVAWSLSLPPPRHRRISDVRVGLWLDDPECPIEDGAAQLLQAAAAALEAAGATVTGDHPRLDLAEIRRLFTGLLLPAVSVSLDEEIGQALSGSHRTWLELDRRRAAVRHLWAEWFRDHDVLLCPVVPMLPFPHDHEGTSGRPLGDHQRPRPPSVRRPGLDRSGRCRLPAVDRRSGRAGGGPSGRGAGGGSVPRGSNRAVRGRASEPAGGRLRPAAAGRRLTLAALSDPEGGSRRVT